MRPLLFALTLALSAAWAAGPALIVADEVPAMEVLARRLKSEGIDSRIVRQPEMPADLSPYRSLIVYIHRNITSETEHAAITFTDAGGKLVLLHHSISSGKRSNRDWLPYLGVQLPQGDVDAGGYKWIDPVDLEIVNLAPKHYVTTRGVKYGERVRYTSPDLGGGERTYPGFALKDTEVYLNHVFTGPRTVLLGLKYTDPKTGKLWMQDRAGWHRRAGKGEVYYFMPGHSEKEFEHPTYSRIVVNALTYDGR